MPGAFINPAWQSVVAQLASDAILAAAPPSLAAGYAVLAASVLLLAVGGYATLLSAAWPHTGIAVCAQ